MGKIEIQETTSLVSANYKNESISVSLNYALNKDGVLTSVSGTAYDVDTHDYLGRFDATRSGDGKMQWSTSGVNDIDATALIVTAMRDIKAQLIEG